MLENSGKETFDFVCWTHPHDDHTVGMDRVLEKYCDSDTIFSMPCYDILNREYTENVQKAYNSLFEIIKSKKKRKMHVCPTSDRKMIESFLCRKTNGIDKFRFEINSFAPNGNILLSQYIKDIKTIGNLYSIGLIISVGEFSIMLAGDVEDRTIEQIPKFYIDRQIDYIKIPHHASNTSGKIIDKLKGCDMEAPEIATSTVYRSHDLPDENILERYIEWNHNMKLFLSGDLIPQKDYTRLGLIRTIFNLTPRKEEDIITELHGNAVQINNNRFYH